MAKTHVGINSPRAVKRFSGALTLDVSQQSFFGNRFTAVGTNAKSPVQILADLQSEAGEQISYDLLAELTMAPIEGDDVLEGKEEAQRFYTDKLYIDQARCGVNTGGAMTRKRTLHNLRQRARQQQASWWARFQDELLMVYLAGTRGTNPNYLLPAGYTGRANNTVTAPTAPQHVFANAAATSTSVGNTDDYNMKTATIDAALTRALTQGGGATGIPVLQPCNVGGEDVYVMVMHTWQEDDLRADAGTGGWLEIQKAAAGALGSRSPLFHNTLGMYRNVILHSHRNVPTIGTGSSSNVAGARALFMGAQAGVIAFGSPGTGMRYSWHEETRDNGNQVVITTSSIFGVKKSTFEWDGTDYDQGVYAVETRAVSR